MHRRMVQSSLRGLSLLQVRHVKPVGFDAARDGVAQVYRELERDFGVLAPPIALHSPAFGPLAASWLMLREPMLVAGVAARTTKEAVAAAVSVANECPFCIRMHSAMLHSLAPGKDSAAIREGRLDQVADPAVRAVADWVRDGAVRDTAAKTRFPFAAEQVPELLGSVVIMHYLNRMVNVFLGAMPLPPGAPESSLRPVMKVLTWLLRSAARAEPKAGGTLGLLPAAALPADLAWAASNPQIAAAFARAAAAVELAGRAALPDGVRELVLDTVDAWDGRPPGLGRGWADAAVETRPAEERPAARLALLTALAAYTVDETVVDAARAAGADDEALIGITAWASLTAARAVGAWMYQPE
ncbi:AhpD family alkylhydroperoxidase [Kitasatospora gansuensis]|uniref:AhpD family alkylhydroperoxidase n=1 Tax=Kitasatospora gansuensis TaxID=258050 RepID=A0A7W7WLP7_9ACTN|nr:carboxymuconolactone decarboxylase family protein [Kitasatospora gansuensis]MBB4951478.1 AhpD family alkylhydroperoxidase [Kitasatospora gansuensis]